MQRPGPDEYYEYYGRYITLIPDGEITDLLEAQIEEVSDFFSAISEETARHRYAPGKWSIKEVLGHVVDTERVFSTRGLAFARGDATPLPSFEQDEYVAGADFDARPLADIVEEFRHLRAANICLFRSLSEGVSERTGTASGYSFTVRTIPYILAGHLMHHLDVLRERYLG